MAKLTLQRATEIAASDDIGLCLSCDNLAVEGHDYCTCCASYWQDVDEGLFDEDDDWDAIKRECA
jgi:hypothetical protein